MGQTRAGKTRVRAVSLSADAESKLADLVAYAKETADHGWERWSASKVISLLIGRGWREMVEAERRAGDGKATD